MTRAFKTERVIMETVGYLIKHPKAKVLVYCGGPETARRLEREIKKCLEILGLPRCDLTVKAIGN